MKTLLIRLAPAIFVVLWSTGYIAASYALPDAEPMTFLASRYALVVALFAPLALVRRRPWPARPVDWLHAAVTGICLHCLGLGGVFLAIDRQVEAGVSALIMGLQPVLTALFAATVLRERLAVHQVLGLVLGFAGVGLVVSERIGAGAGSPAGVAWNLLGMAAMTAGTLYQKARSQHADPINGAVIQFAAASIACVTLAVTFGETASRWTPQVLGALAWAVLVLSVIATSLLYWLIRHGAMAGVSSLFYLVPVSAALLAWLLFDERFSSLAVAGMVVTVVGVALVTRNAASSSAR